MKKFFIFLLLGSAVVGAVFINISCNTASPTTSNFQSPIGTIVALNPTITPTFTFTPTVTFTVTPTPTVTNTPAPFQTATWPGFSGPRAAAVDNNNVGGGVFIADTGHGQVVKYTFSGSLDTSWGSGGKGKGKIPALNPSGVAVDGTGNLYVVGGNAGVNKYDSLGNLTNQFTSVTFTNPQGVAVDGNGNIYVSDSGANVRFVQLNPNGTQGVSFGGAGAVTFTAPVTAIDGIAADASGAYIDVVVRNSSGYSNVLRYNTGSSSPSSSITGFASPIGVALDSAGDLYVTDLGPARVEEFLAGNTSVPDYIYGYNQLSNPTGIAVDSRGFIYATDSVLNEVVVFAP